MKTKITCKQAVDYISRKEENKLHPRELLLLWMHLAICRFCRMFTVQNKIIARALSGYRQENTITAFPEERKQQLIDAILKEES